MPQERLTLLSRIRNSTAIWFSVVLISMIVASLAWAYELAWGNWGMAVAAAGGLVAAFASYEFGRRTLPGAYYVAIIGFPESGKTTLLTSLFGEVFARRIARYSFAPTGESTIERVNRDLALLNKGRAIGPTKDQDRFSYTATINMPGFILSRSYKVEFGDFPGERSEEFSNEFGEWLHKTEFFKWAINADAFVFVIDVARLLGPPEIRKEYVADMTRSVRAAWQHVVDHHAERADRVRRKRVALVFTKSDLFGATEHYSPTALQDAIAALGFGEKVPSLQEIDLVALSKGIQSVKAEFADLTNYLGGECRHFKVVFVSSFGLKNHARLGLEELLLSVLPQ